MACKSTSTLWHHMADDDDGDDDNVHLILEREMLIFISRGKLNNRAE